MIGNRDTGDWVAGGAKSCAALLLFTLPGCVSYSYVDKDVLHVVGFVDIATPLSNGKAPEADSTSVTVTTLGAALQRIPNANGFTLGYSRETVVSLPRGGCLDLNTKGVCASRQASPANTIE